MVPYFKFKNLTAIQIYTM